MLRLSKFVTHWCCHYEKPHILHLQIWLSFSEQIMNSTYMHTSHTQSYMFFNPVNPFLRIVCKFLLPVPYNNYGFIVIPGCRMAQGHHLERTLI